MRAQNRSLGSAFSLAFALDHEVLQGRAEFGLVGEGVDLAVELDLVGLHAGLDGVGVGLERAQLLGDDLHQRHVHVGDELRGRVLDAGLEDVRPAVDEPRGHDVTQFLQGALVHPCQSVAVGFHRHHRLRDVGRRRLPEEDDEVAGGRPLELDGRADVVPLL
jgi:hypothetical protein